MGPFLMFPLTLRFIHFDTVYPRMGLSFTYNPYRKADFKLFSAGIDFTPRLRNQTNNTMSALRAYRKYNERILLRLLISFVMIGAAMLLLL
jgi:hypothetical protein